MNARTISQAAAELGLSPRQLRHLVRQPGAPIVRAGRPGRGGSALIDPVSFRAWMTGGAAPAPEPHEALARNMVREIAVAIVAEFKLTSGPHKRAMSEATVRNFIATANAVRRQLGLGELTAEELPPEIVQLTQVVSFSANR